MSSGSGMRLEESTVGGINVCLLGTAVDWLAACKVVAPVSSVTKVANLMTTAFSKKHSFLFYLIFEYTNTHYAIVL